VNSLDLKTLILMSMLMAGAMSIVLFSAHRSFPSEVKGLGYWALGSLTLMLSAILFGLRGFFPNAVVLLCANAALFWAIGFSMIGTQKFYGRAPGWLLFHLVWGIGMACVGWWLLGEPNFDARVAVFSFFVSIFYLVQLGLIVRHGERHFSTYFFGSLMLIQASAVIARGVAALHDGGGSVDLESGGPFLAVYVAISNFMSLLLTVGFMTVATRRLQILLEKRSNLDPLTSALNRRGFAEIYAQEKARMQRDLQPMTFLSVDLDYFKSINDSFGHAVGDSVLVHAANTIRNALRATDHMARFGGEEFVVLLPETDKDIAHVIAERIQSSLRGAPSDGLPAFTVSIGISCQTTPEETLDAVLVRADAALYRAKEGGRDRIEVAELAATL
jgi:diguanylate cyclase (GGDEF)-like protein